MGRRRRSRFQASDKGPAFVGAPVGSVLSTMNLSNVTCASTSLMRDGRDR